MRPSLTQIVVGACLLLVVSGVLLALAQPSRGEGRFEFEIRQSFEGVFRSRPVPALWVLRRQDPGPFSNYSVYPLVGTGFHGLSPSTSNLDGVAVTLQGKLLYNGVFTAIETEESSIQRISWVVEFPEPTPAEELGSVVLRGEILDLKSYAGYQEPNLGSWLIAPASNAIRGGVPPVLVVRNRQGDERAMLLLNRRGESLGQQALGLLGIAVEVRGRLAVSGGLLMLEVEPGSIRRLSPWE